MEALTFLKEKGRLTKNCEIDCSDCRLSLDNNKFNLPCKHLSYYYPEEAIKIIEEWSQEVDWETIKVDERLLVSNDRFFWHKRHFAKYDKETNTIYVYQQGCSSFTTSQIESFKYAKMYTGQDLV